MGPREITLIVCGCVIFVSICAIVGKYIYIHRKQKDNNKDNKDSN